MINLKKFDMYNIIKKIKENSCFISSLFLISLIIILYIFMIITRTQIRELQKDVRELSYNYNQINYAVNNKQDYVIKNITNSKKENSNLKEEKTDVSYTEIKNKWNINLTKDEIDLLAQIVWLEAGNQCQEGQMAVVEVIFNRMVDSYYQGTLEEVLSRPKQFSTWKNRNISKPTEEIYDSINKVLNGETDILPLEVLYFAGTSNGRTVVKTIEDHVFCK